MQVRVVERYGCRRHLGKPWKRLQGRAAYVVVLLLLPVRQGRRQLNKPHQRLQGRAAFVVVLQLQLRQGRRRPDKPYQRLQRSVVLTVVLLQQQQLLQLLPGSQSL